MGLTEFFTDDHRACDDLWADVESADADGMAEAFARFDHAMRRHLGWEEESLFPAFETATGMRGGPTFVMRSEHAQMRALLDQMANARADQLLRLGDTLMMLIAQHNAKEEGMLYPMASQVLAESWEAIHASLH